MQITEELIREIVTEVVGRIEAMRSKSQKSFSSAAPQVRFHSKVLTGGDVEYYFREGVEVLRLSSKTIITPLAKERSGDLKIELILE